jgi:hypothetical protein
MLTRIVSLDFLLIAAGVVCEGWLQACCPSLSQEAPAVRQVLVTLVCLPDSVTLDVCLFNTEVCTAPMVTGTRPKARGLDTRH